MREAKRHRELKKSIADKIRAMREARFFTQGELAKLAKLSQSTTAQVETGRKEPSTETLFKIAAALDAPPAFFLS